MVNCVYIFHVHISLLQFLKYFLKEKPESYTLRHFFVCITVPSNSLKSSHVALLYHFKDEESET